MAWLRLHLALVAEAVIRNSGSPMIFAFASSFGDMIRLPIKTQLVNMGIKKFPGRLWTVTLPANVATMDIEVFQRILH